MNKHYNEDVQALIDDAIHEARIMGNSFVGSEHILLAILKYKDHPFSKKLKLYGLDYMTLQNEFYVLFCGKYPEDEEILFTQVVEDLLEKVETMDDVIEYLLTQDHSVAYEYLKGKNIYMDDIHIESFSLDVLDTMILHNHKYHCVIVEDNIYIHSLCIQQLIKYFNKYSYKVLDRSIQDLNLEELYINNIQILITSIDTFIPLDILHEIFHQNKIHVIAFMQNKYIQSDIHWMKGMTYIIYDLYTYDPILILRKYIEEYNIPIDEDTFSNIYIQLENQNVDLWIDLFLIMKGMKQRLNEEQIIKLYTMLNKKGNKYERNII